MSTQAQINTAGEKRAFKRSVQDMRGRDLLNLLIENELLLILHPDDGMALYKRDTCYDMIEWRLRATENRDENVGTRVSNLRCRIKATLKKKDTQLNEKLLNRAASELHYAQEETRTARMDGYNEALRHAELKKEREAADRKKKRDAAKVK
jgi:hypothetical protein